MKHEINRLVKFREDYRPLAPAILHEQGDAWFESYQESPYMERALAFRPEAKPRVPAVVHADGTGRLQSVTKAMNPWLHTLISSFFEQTGVPLVVNTSLNVMGKPIVHGVKDAVQLLFTTGLSHLAIGNVLLYKK
jgi:carbamoyltransferase